MYGKYLIKHTNSDLYLSVCGSETIEADRKVCLLNKISGSKSQVWQIVEKPYK
jgi:hypothetical protein